MKTVNTKLWKNWQILVPHEVAEAIGVKPDDHIRFCIIESGVTVEKLTED